MNVVWSPLARAQLLEAFAFIAEHDYDTAIKVFSRVDERVTSLAELPGLGVRGREPGTQELVISGTRYKFILVYRVVGEQIQVAAFWHGRQNR